MAAAGKARHCLPAGAEVGRQGFSGSRHQQGRLRRGLARTEDLERRRHPGAQSRSGADPGRRCPAIPTITRRAISKPPSSGILVTSLYLPNGNPQPGPKFDYKLAWFRRLKSHAAKFLKQDIPVVLAGDYNVAPTELDIYPTRSWDKDALIQPKSRAAFKSLVAQGWCDAIRSVHPSKPMFTFWDYKRNRWPRDAGLRLDHLLLSPGTCAAADQGRRRPQDAGRRRRQRSRASLDCH